MTFLLIHAALLLYQLMTLMIAWQFITLNHFNANVTQVKKIQHYQVWESWLFLIDPTSSRTVGKK